MKRSKVLSLILTLCLIIGITPTSASALTYVEEISRPFVGDYVMDTDQLDGSNIVYFQKSENWVGDVNLKVPETGAWYSQVYINTLDRYKGKNSATGIESEHIKNIGDGNFLVFTNYSVTNVSDGRVCREIKLGSDGSVSTRFIIQDTNYREIDSTEFIPMKKIDKEFTESLKGKYTVADDSKAYLKTMSDIEFVIDNGTIEISGTKMDTGEKFTDTFDLSGHISSKYTDGDKTTFRFESHRYDNDTHNFIDLGTIDLHLSEDGTGYMIGYQYRDPITEKQYYYNSKSLNEEIPLQRVEEAINLDTPFATSLVTESKQYRLSISGWIEAEVVNGSNTLTLEQIKQQGIAISVKNNNTGEVRVMDQNTIEGLEIIVKNGKAIEIILQGRVQTSKGTLERYTVTATL